jgi:hypothetical protein
MKLLGIPGAACWIAGQVKMNRCSIGWRGAAVACPSAAPVGSHGLSLPWQF